MRDSQNRPTYTYSCIAGQKESFLMLNVMVYRNH